MGVQALVANLIDHLVWPGAVVGLCFLFRTPIGELISRIDRATSA